MLKGSRAVYLTFFFLIFCLVGPLWAGEVDTEGRIEAQVAKLVETDQKEVLVSTGVPFSPGMLFAEENIAVFDGTGKEIPIAVKVLARWTQDKSIRSILVQFPYTINHKYAPVTLEWGKKRRTVPDRAIQEVKESMPEGYILLPAIWLCNSLVVGEQVPMMKGPYVKLSEQNYQFPKYDQNIYNTFPKLSSREYSGDVRQDGYYDVTHVFYQLYVRAGLDEYFKAARREALQYREQILLDGPERGRHKTYKQTRYIYVQAMIDDYLLTGDEKSLQIARYMAEYLKNNYSPEQAFYPKTAKGFWTEREPAFPFLGIVTYYELTGEKEYLTATDAIMKNLYKTQQQWPGRGGFIHNLYSHDPEEGARPNEYGGSPFMTGLLLEAIVKYHQLTQSEVAKESIYLALDWLIKECLAPNGNSFIYTTADSQKGEGHPDLNLLIAQAFGYGYKISGYQNKEYLAIGTRIFEYGINNAYLGDRKHFNQNYRSSGHWLGYIAKK